MSLRQAAAKALEAIESGESFDHLDEVIAPLLRAALDEPQTTHWEGCEAVHLECKANPRKPLTDEEIDRVTDQQWAQNNHKPIYAAHRAYARAIEAKLKEKNA